MRERISMKSKMLGALALLTLIGTLFVMQSAQQHAPTADAAAGSIAALNVGTCLTTDATVFKGDCDALSEGATGTGAVGEDIRTKITGVSTLYATYAYDPKTASDEPRAILMDSDLLQIRIADADRDKRTGVLVRGESYEGENDNVDSNDTVASFDEDREDSLADVIRTELDNDGLDYQTVEDSDPDDKDLEIRFTSEDVLDDGIEVYIGGGTDTTSSVINDSGNHTLNFKREQCDGTNVSPCADGDEWQFDPGDFKIDDGAVVRFYGCLADGDTATSCADTDARDNLKDYLTVDEDASNGEASGDTAPWLGVNASIPSGKNIVIEAIYYRTSVRENLVGGETYRYCSDHSSPSETNNGWSCDGGMPAIENDGSGKETHVVYTDKEKSANSRLKVEAGSDGRVRSVDLYLTETDRFSGVYQGYLRLTDADADGRVHSTDGMTRDNWGRPIVPGKGDTANKMATKETAAVLGVNSDPVKISYRDSDGNTQTLRIEIDRQPPTINIESPANGSSSGDQSPDFAGTIDDADSGLVDTSFRLVVDNEVDGGTADYAVSIATNVAGSGSVSYQTEYTGYGDAPNDLFGYIAASTLYNLGDDSCDDSTCYIESEEYDDGANRGTFDDSVRLDLIDSNDDPVETRDAEFDIDFQAFVMDMAGNIGFSDADVANPRFINDLGTTEDPKVPNVLGYYSAHVVKLDEKDPEIDEDGTATGYFGRTSDGTKIADRFGVMIAFDGPIASSSVSNGTFSVELDDGSSATVVEHQVDKDYVFLKLATELASDATPKIDIVQGEKVEDMAGNETFGREVTAFDAQDGISPKLVVTLSGGSGSGVGDEGPEKLTNKSINIHVSSDEPLQSAPRIAVVCSSLRWNEGGEMDSNNAVFENHVGSRKDVGDYVANRNRSSDGEPFEEPVVTKPRSSNTEAAGETYDYTCGYDANDDNFGDTYSPRSLNSLTRPGENWEQTWLNPSGANAELNNGPLTVVAYARDRSSYELENWGAASAEFTYDTDLASPLNGGGELQPDDGDVSKEVRPFVLIDFSESTTVTLDSVQLDDVEIASEFEQPEPNRFVYWPLSLVRGDHEVEVEATDAAGNEVSFEYSFTVEERGDFLLNLLAGWNAISVPADPVDTAIGAVFTNPEIDTVIGWDTDGWRIAVRRDGVWESNHQYGTLNEIRAKYGYWVKSNNFVRQPIALTANDRGVGGPRTPIAIDTNPGWNFVGVIDQDGDQTEGDSGLSLKAGNEAVYANEYLGASFVRAYTWDATFNRFDALKRDVPMTIGQGVWVYYEGGIAP